MIPTAGGASRTTTSLLTKLTPEQDQAIQIIHNTVNSPTDVYNAIQKIKANQNYAKEVIQKYQQQMGQGNQQQPEDGCTIF